MAREIKFRVKATYTGEWAYGFPQQSEWDDEWYIFPPQGVTARPAIVERETLSQFTGRMDRNGTPIYEGDIIDLYDEECGLCGSRFEVVYSEEEARFAFVNRVEGHEYTMGFDKSWRNNIYVVIGNKWDNPDLLKGGERN